MVKITYKSKQDVIKKSASFNIYNKELTMSLWLSELEIFKENLDLGILSDIKDLLTKFEQKEKSLKEFSKELIQEEERLKSEDEKQDKEEIQKKIKIVIIIKQILD